MNNSIYVFYWSHWGPQRKCTLIVKQPLTNQVYMCRKYTSYFTLNIVYINSIYRAQYRKISITYMFLSISGDHMGSHHWLDSPSKRCNINLACWIWPCYPALNREYKIIVKIVLFAKQWSWVLNQRGWLYRNDLHILHFGVIWGSFQDPDSRNNKEFQVNIT